jgi:replicative DNA helicase
VDSFVTTLEKLEPSPVAVNLPIERETLGALIESGAILTAALDCGLCSDDFFLSDHRKIFAAILELRKEKAPIDFHIVADRLGNSDRDVSLIADCITGAVIAESHVLFHCGLLRKKASLRKLAKLAEWILREVTEPNADPDAIRREMTKQ